MTILRGLSLACPVTAIASMATETVACAQAVDGRPVVVVLEGRSGDAVPSATALQAAIENELRVKVLSAGDPAAPSARGVLTVDFGDRRDELSVRYRPHRTSAGSSREMVRRVAAPKDPVEAVRAAAFLAGNLARDESEELLEAARREHAEADRAPPKTPDPATATNEDSKNLVEGPAAIPPTPATPDEERNARDLADQDERNAELRRACERARATAPHHPATLSLFYPVATNFGRPGVRANLHLDVLYGRAGFIDGLGVGLFTRVQCDVGGVLASSIFSRVEGSVVGLQASGLVGKADEAIGLLASGVVSISKRIEGVQAAGVFASNEQRVDGFQVSPVSLGADVNGLQAGVVAVGRDVDGAQASVVGIQREVNGLQIGVVNVAKRVRGAQVGVINVAEDMQGADIALIPLAKNGAIRPVVFGSVTSYGNVGVEFDTRYTFAMISAGYGGAGAPGNDGVATFQIGVHTMGPPDRGGFFLDPMIGNETPLSWREADQEIRILGRLRAGYRFAPRLAVFGGLGGAVVAERPRDGGARDVRFLPDAFAGVLF